jgi:hypothetical protein
MATDNRDSLLAELAPHIALGTPRRYVQVIAGSADLTGRCALALVVLNADSTPYPMTSRLDFVDGRWEEEEFTELEGASRSSSRGIWASSAGGLLPAWATDVYVTHAGLARRQSHLFDYGWYWDVAWYAERPSTLPAVEFVSTAR